MLWLRWAECRVFGWAGTHLVANAMRFPAKASRALQAAGSVWRDPSQLYRSVVSGLHSGMSCCSNIVLQVPLALDLMVQIGSVLTSCIFCVVFAGSGMVWRVKTEVFMGFWAYGTAYSLLHSPPPWAQSLLWPDTSTHLQCYPRFKNLSSGCKSLELCADVASDVGIKAKSRLLRFL